MEQTTTLRELRHIVREEADAIITYRLSSLESTIVNLLADNFSDLGESIEDLGNFIHLTAQSGQNQPRDFHLHEH